MGHDSGSPLDYLILDEALEKLAEHNERRAKVVEFRVFAGMGARETAAALGVSERTVREDLRVAKAWLAREIGRCGG